MGPSLGSLVVGLMMLGFVFEEGLDKNFAGLFPVIDWVFGTFYMPEELQPERFGVDGDDVPEGLLAQRVYPFRRS